MEVPSTFAPLDRVPVTADYVVGPGDEIVVRVWRQIDVDVKTVVVHNGAIHIPQAGTMNVAGIKCWHRGRNDVKVSVAPRGVALSWDTD